MARSVLAESTYFSTGLMICIRADSPLLRNFPPCNVPQPLFRRCQCPADGLPCICGPTSRRSWTWSAECSCVCGSRRKLSWTLRARMSLTTMKRRKKKACVCGGDGLFFGFDFSPCYSTYLASCQNVSLYLCWECRRGPRLLLLEEELTLLLRLRFRLGDESSERERDYRLLLYFIHNILSYLQSILAFINHPLSESIVRLVESLMDIFMMELLPLRIYFNGHIRRHPKRC